MKNISTSVLRLLLVVLISTFMSPSFAWQMIDSHSEMPSASVAADADHHENDAYHHHDGDGDEDDGAHSQIGHLLSHLPAVMHNIAPLPVQQENTTTYSICLRTFSLAATDPPFKPPRAFFFV